jgi:hypothetical protein
VKVCVKSVGSAMLAMRDGRAPARGLADVRGRTGRAEEPKNARKRPSALDLLKLALSR